MGNLTRDPELKTLPSGSSVANFGIATNRVWRNQQGEKQEEVQFHNIVVFGKQADTVSQYLKKFLSHHGRISPKSETGVCARHQRKLATAIKRARIIGLLPFVTA